MWRNLSIVYFNKLHNLKKAKAAMRAYKLMLSRRFHSWESGEGKITAQYTLALLQMAHKALKEGRFAGTEKILRDALAYPENFGEGMIEGTKDNHNYYHLALEGQGRTEKARSCFQRATTGTDEPAGAMYYND